MTLKKTIPSFLKSDGTWEPQKDIDMHPLEEAEIRAHWAIHDVLAKIPPKPTKEQEHEWLIENGAEFVKLKRDEWQKYHDEIMPEVEAAQAKAQACVKAWGEHCDFCIKNGFNYDTYDKEKYRAS